MRVHFLDFAINHIVCTISGFGLSLRIIVLRFIKFVACYQEFILSSNLFDRCEKKFLSLLEITFRRDLNNYRPRTNKFTSIKDAEQKKSGNDFFLDD